MVRMGVWMVVCVCQPRVNLVGVPCHSPSVGWDQLSWPYKVVKDDDDDDDDDDDEQSKDLYQIRSFCLQIFCLQL